jgi:hypothetical protein
MDLTQHSMVLMQMMAQYVLWRTFVTSNEAQVGS